MDDKYLREVLAEECAKVGAQITAAELRSGRSSRVPSECVISAMRRVSHPHSTDRDAVLEEWQPIETAPKDGTFVDVFDGGRFVDCVFVKTAVYPSGIWLQRESDFRVNPSHWMPIPEPPIAIRSLKAKTPA